MRRYERENPGELLHIDIKKLGRFERTDHRITGDRTGQSDSHSVGWEYVHVYIDDAPAWPSPRCQSALKQEPQSVRSRHRESLSQTAEYTSQPTVRSSGTSSRRRSAYSLWTCDAPEYAGLPKKELHNLCMHARNVCCLSLTQSRAAVIEPSRDLEPTGK